MNSTATAAEKADESAAAATERSKLSEQDKVQRLTDRLAHSVTDLSLTKPDQTSSGPADKERWAETRGQISSHTFISRCEICVKKTTGVALKEYLRSYFK